MQFYLIRKTEDVFWSILSSFIFCQNNSNCYSKIQYKTKILAETDLFLFLQCTKWFELDIALIQLQYSKCNCENILYLSSAICSNITHCSINFTFFILAVCKRCELNCCYSYCVSNSPTSTLPSVHSYPNRGVEGHQVPEQVSSGESDADWHSRKWGRPLPQHLGPPGAYRYPKKPVLV